MKKNKALILLTLVLLLFSSNLLCQTNKSIIKIICEPNVLVTINNKFVGKTNKKESGLLVKNLKKGTYKVQLNKMGCYKQNKKLNISSNKIYTFKAKPFEELVYILFEEDDANEETKTVETLNNMPAYPRGYKALSKFIKETMIYPKDALKNKIWGTVYLKFIVSTKGKIKDIKIVEALYPSLDKEAIRIVKKFPKWIPGKSKGKIVEKSYIQPIEFKLN